MIVGEVTIGGGKLILELIEQGTRFKEIRATNTAPVAVIVRVWVEGVKEVEQRIGANSTYTKNLPASPTIQAYVETMDFGWHVRIA
jgi:hypothetical protein